MIWLGACWNCRRRIELCVFAGKLSAVLDVLIVLEEAGVPVHGPDEKPHLLGWGAS